jgi:hypothetical protein
MTQPLGAPHRRLPVGHIVLAVLGAIAILVGLPMAAAGGFLTWAHATQRDDDGFLTTDRERLETVSYAIVSEDLDLGVDHDQPVDLGDLATVRITVDTVGDDPVFVGIGPYAAVRDYLDGVAHAEIADADFDPFEVRYRFVEGDAPAEAPTEQDFWAATSSGPGAQTLEWDLESGRYAVVIMNADGSAGVGVLASVGVKLDWLLAAGVGLLVAALFAFVVGTVMLVIGIHGLISATPAPVIDAIPGAEPVRLTGTLDQPPGRWLWLVKWLLLIPHFVVLTVLWVAVAVVTVVAWFAILFTGRYPRPLFDFTAGVLRWSWRVGFYSFGAFGTDRYPPFTFGPVPDYPASLDIAYPDQLSRGLVLVKSWLLAIPHLVVVGILVGGAYADSGDRGAGAPGLIAWLALVAAVVLLFTARYPSGLFDFVIGLNRWVYRVAAYVLLMTDRYPPFRLDQGPTEPVTPAVPVVPVVSTAPHDRPPDV